MTTSKVFGITLRAHFKESLPQKIVRLFKAMEPEKNLSAGQLLALKLHFGEQGCTAFIRPILIRALVDYLKEAKTKPFLTDANTLYVGARANSVDHTETALLNGFGYTVCGAPITIADGLRGTSQVAVDINQELIKTAYIAADLMEADGLISLAHVKGHELTGFGGAMKNVGMGGASRRGKLEQHSAVGPKIKKKNCVGCKACLKHCAQTAISIQKDRKAYIDPAKCVGCAECIPLCNYEAIEIQWNAEVETFMKKMTEYTLAAVKGKEDRCFYINFLTQISPLCDCVNHSDAPITADIGIIASRDPVAIDQASADLVNQMPGQKGSALGDENLAPGSDKWLALQPKVNWQVQLDYAEKIGLGHKKYELIWLPEA